MDDSRFAKLTVIANAGHDARGNRLVLVQCDCGSRAKTVRMSNLRTGNTVSCGCHGGNRFGTANKPIVHGDARKGRKTTEWVCWVGMRQRCYDSNHHSFENYGARGIKVCSRWLENFQNFLSDMGRKPSKAHSIDRIDNDGDYEPGNCRWATSSEQNLNKRNSLASRE